MDSATKLRQALFEKPSQINPNNMKANILSVFPAITAFASAAVIHDSNFNSLTTGAVANNTTISTGLVAEVNTNTVLTTVDLGSGNKALDFTDNNSSFVGNGAPLIYSPNANFSSVTTGATGINKLQGSFDLTRLGATVPFQFYIQNINQIGTATASTAIRLEIAASGAVSYIGTTVTVATGFTMAQDTSYTFNYNVDLSSTTQDTFGFSIAATSAPLTNLFSVSSVGTRSANGTPGIAVFRGGSNSSAQSSSAAFRLDNAYLSTIPEPSAISLLGLVGVLAALRRQRI